MMGMDMDSTTTAGMAMPTASESHDHMSSMMSSESMAMVFFQSTMTPLYSMAWMPASSGAYVGTCIFLIVLAVAHRILLAARHLIFDGPHEHRPEGGSPDHTDEEDNEKAAAARRIKRAWNTRPFRIAFETSRAIFEVIVGGVGYLL